MSKLQEAAIERLIAEAEEQRNKAFEAEDWAKVSAMESYITGLTVALAVIHGTE